MPFLEYLKYAYKKILLGWGFQGFGAEIKPIEAK